MKTWILRASAAAFMAGMMGSVACGGSSSGCGGTNINANSAPTTISMQCGQGTYLRNNQCVPIPASSNAAPAQKVITN
ncbi:MAG TPA: hypothetical protein VN915_15205 [Elusimicrobiota bacterium]|nr:hypothetical protein [Elusimicrobiota bacterium]